MFFFPPSHPPPYFCFTSWESFHCQGVYNFQLIVETVQLWGTFFFSSLSAARVLLRGLLTHSQAFMLSIFVLMSCSQQFLLLTLDKKTISGIIWRCYIVLQRFLRVSSKTQSQRNRMWWKKSWDPLRRERTHTLSMKRQNIQKQYLRGKMLPVMFTSFTIVSNV